MRPELIPTLPSNDVLARLTELTHAICDTPPGAEALPLLREFTVLAGSPRTGHHIRNHWRGEDTEQFVKAAAAPPAPPLDDLAWDEVVAVITRLEGAEEWETTWLLQALGTWFPGVPVSDLFYWPNHFFGREDLLHIELTPEEQAGWLVARSGRTLERMPPDWEPPALPEPS